MSQKEKRSFPQKRSPLRGGIKGGGADFEKLACTESADKERMYQG